MLTISVLIPAYNEEKRIARALDSIMSQTMLPDEVIVIDDGSTDNTYNLAKEHPLKNILKLRVYSKVNGGLSSARNFGIQKSKSDFIALLDSDDEFESEHIEYLHKSYELFPESNVFYSAIKRKFSSKKIALQESHLPDFREISRQHKKYPSLTISPLKDTLFDNLIGGNFITTSSSMFKKIIDCELVFFDESLKYSEDRYFYLNLSILMPPIFIDKVNVIIHRDGNNVSNVKNSFLHRKYSVEVLERLYCDSRFKDLHPKVIEVLSDHLEDLLYVSSKKGITYTVSSLKKCYKYKTKNINNTKRLYYFFSSIVHTFKNKLNR